MTLPTLSPSLLRYGWSDSRKRETRLRLCTVCAKVVCAAQVASCYPERTQEFVAELSTLLDRHYAVMNSSLRQTLAKSLILLRNRKQVTL